jgi:GNAT superfamily N-acetyltransferase
LRRIKDCLDVVKIEDILEVGALKACADLTWRSYWPILEAPETENRLALVAFADEAPVALWLSVKTPLQDQPQGHTLLSLFVAPAWRRRGVGTHLMQVAETKLAARGVSSLTTSYSSILPGADAMSGLLLNQSWNEPTPDRIRICGRVGDTVTTSRAWDVLLRRLERRGLRYLSWQEADIGVLEQAGAMVDAGHAPEWSDPRPWNEVLSRPLSLAILDGKGALSGWVICEHQPNLSRWYFPIGWVTPAEQDRGTLVGAYLEGSRRIQSEHGSSALAVLEASPRQGRAWKLFENHFSSFALWSDRLLVSQKFLHQSGCG